MSSSSEGGVGGLRLSEAIVKLASGRDATAYISRSALSKNLAVAQRHAPGAQVMAVVKANAYGFGLSQALPAFDKADALAVATVTEAVNVRAFEPNKRLVVLQGVRSYAELHAVRSLKLTVSVHCKEQLDMLSAFDQETSSSYPSPPSAIDVWLKVNTGMNRLGVPCADVESIWSQLNALSSLNLQGIMTHFACADESGAALTELQQQRFQQLVTCLGLNPSQCSMANSAATLSVFSGLNQQGAWIRPGIMLYGGNPLSLLDKSNNVSHIEDPSDLQVAMWFVSRIIAVQSIAKGESIGYGATYVADCDMIIAVVAAGYGDGYPRHVRPGQPVAIHGALCSIVGRVSMDMMTVDVTSLASKHPVAVGDAVELWGGQVLVDDVAEEAGTISYELFCQLTPRVERLLLDELV